MFGLVRRGAAIAAIMATAVAALAGCGSDVKGGHADLVAGKQLFVQRCGACHTLARAGTRGTAGPNLDDAFVQSLDDGLGRSTLRGIVEEQILHPSRSGQMPAKLVAGQAATDVAAYVAGAAAKPGEDTGALASAVRAVSRRTTTAQGGRLEIDANPDGQLAYEVSSATASAGLIEIYSRNASSTPHDIALDDPNGRKIANGAVVSNGGVSGISVDLRPGRYTYFCTVPGHREGGMEGTLTVR